jgi:hypothetical protein
MNPLLAAPHAATNRMNNGKSALLSAFPQVIQDFLAGRAGSRANARLANRAPQDLPMNEPGAALRLAIALTRQTNA